MLVCGHRLKLSEQDRRLLVWASQGMSVDHIRTVEQLADFIHRIQRLYPGRTADERRIRMLLERFIPDEEVVETDGNVLRLTRI